MAKSLQSQDGGFLGQEPGMLASLRDLKALGPGCTTRSGKRLPVALKAQASSLAEETPWGAPMPALPATPFQGQAGPSSPYSLGHGKHKVRLVGSLSFGCSRRRGHWLSEGLASGWVLPLPCCVTLASHFPSLGLSFWFCKRKSVIPASLTSTPPDDSAA